MNPFVNGICPARVVCIYEHAGRQRDEVTQPSMGDISVGGSRKSMRGVSEQLCKCCVFVCACSLKIPTCITKLHVSPAIRCKFPVAILSAAYQNSE